MEGSCGSEEPGPLHNPHLDRNSPVAVTGWPPGVGWVMGSDPGQQQQQQQQIQYSLDKSLCASSAKSSLIVKVSNDDWEECGYRSYREPLPTSESIIYKVSTNIGSISYSTAWRIKSEWRCISFVLEIVTYIVSLEWMKSYMDVKCIKLQNKHKLSEKNHLPIFQVLISETSATELLHYVTIISHILVLCKIVMLWTSNDTDFPAGQYETRPTLAFYTFEEDVDRSGVFLLEGCWCWVWVNAC